MMRKWWGTVAIVALMVSGCQQAPAPAPVADNGSDDAQRAANESAQQAASRQCMTDALNNTIYKQQTESDLEKALFAQNLDNCPTDFVKSYVPLRNAARDYFAVGAELRANLGKQDSAQEGDWWDLGCSVIAGEKCAEWPSDVWASENAELKQRFEATQTALENAKRTNEDVIANYGLYVSTQQPAPTGNAM